MINFYIITSPYGIPTKYINMRKNNNTQIMIRINNINGFQIIHKIHVII